MKSKKGLFWIALAIIIIIGIFFAYAFLRKGLGNSGSNSTNDSDLLTLNQFHSIQGTSLLVATVEQENARVRDISARWFSFRTGYAVSNLIFLDGSTLSSHSLFETNSNAIIGLYQFPSPNFDSNSNAEQVEVKWLIYEIAKSDTNSDGKINGKDLFTVAISDVGGNNYTEIIENVNDIHGMDLIGDSILMLVYNSNGIYTAVKVDLIQQSIIDSKPLTTIQLESTP